jgi:glycerol-3-phosphate dehydrogenase
VKRDLAALTAIEHDVVVVGGGIHGAAQAWDAAQRGLRTALVEARDFGSGTSWNSLKTIHGGLRYLQHLDLRRMRESIRERSALLRIAPDLVKPLSFVVPVHGHGRLGREAFAVALLVNELLGAGRNEGLRPDRRIPPARLLSRRELREAFPGLSDRGLAGGALWTDAQVESSERLLLAFLHEASAAGAVVANRVEVTSFLRRAGRVVGVRARDHQGGQDVDVRSRIVLNTAGPDMSRLLGLVGLGRSTSLLRAVNFVLRRPVVTRRALGSRLGDRYWFLVPWRDRSIVGTAYAPLEGFDPDEEARFLEEAAAAYPWARLLDDDVTLVHRGRVPGAGGARGLETRDLVLDHERLDGLGGVVSVQGVKYTTARGVAERAVDIVCRRLGREASSRTATTPLSWARPLPGSLQEQARFAAREEMAWSLEDVVLRRLEVGTLGRPSPEVMGVIEGALAAELGWGEERVRREREAVREAYDALSIGGQKL